MVIRKVKRESGNGKSYYFLGLGKEIDQLEKGGERERASMGSGLLFPLIYELQLACGSFVLLFL